MNSKQRTVNNKQASARERGPAYTKAYAFAVRIVKVFKFLSEERREYVLSKQLLKSGTSIGANLAEANAAISEADLSSKVSIAYKEVQETKYWLDLLKETGFLEPHEHKSLYADADEIAAILFATLKTTRIKDRKETSQ